MCRIIELLLRVALEKQGPNLRLSGFGLMLVSVVILVLSIAFAIFLHRVSPATIDGSGIAALVVAMAKILRGRRGG